MHAGVLNLLESYYNKGSSPLCASKKHSESDGGNNSRARVRPAVGAVPCKLNTLQKSRQLAFFLRLAHNHLGLGENFVKFFSGQGPKTNRLEYQLSLSRNYLLHPIVGFKHLSMFEQSL